VDPDRAKIISAILSPNSNPFNSSQNIPIDTTQLCSQSRHSRKLSPLFLLYSLNASILATKYTMMRSQNPYTIFRKSRKRPASTMCGLCWHRHMQQILWELAMLRIWVSENKYNKLFPFCFYSRFGDIG
jgi:hypothetical protein